MAVLPVVLTVAGAAAWQWRAAPQASAEGQVHEVAAPSTPRLEYQGSSEPRLPANPPRGHGDEDPTSDPLPVRREDEHLGEAAKGLRGPTAMPPIPPRAPVDDEPAVPDNPKDFELPASALSR